MIINKNFYNLKIVEIFINKFIKYCKFLLKNKTSKKRLIIMHQPNTNNVLVRAIFFPFSYSCDIRTIGIYMFHCVLNLPS